MSNERTRLPPLVPMTAEPGMRRMPAVAARRAIGHRRAFVSRIDHHHLGAGGAFRSSAVA